MILLIDNYDSFVYNLYQIIAASSEEVKVVRNDVITIAEIEILKPSCIILSPGPGRPEQAGICIDVIKKFAGEIPILGVCLGHQAIGYAFNAKVIQAKHIVHGKSSIIFHHRQGIYKNMMLPFTAARYHSLIIERETLPEDLIIEAETNDGMIMGIRHAKYPIYGVQFHPESILTPEGHQILKNFLQLSSERKNATGSY